LAAILVGTVAVLSLGSGLSSNVLAQSAPSDIFVDEATDLGDLAYEPLAGFTGYGANVGLIRMYGSDATDGAKLRPIMQATFKYRFSEDWIGLGEFGFAWNAFEARKDTVLAVSFGTIGALREFSGFRGMTWRAGGGLGMYRWNYKNNGKSLRDSKTQQFYRGFVPGIQIGFEAERRMSRHVTVTGSLQNHYILASDDKFDSLFDSNFSAVGFRVGASYHFSPYEGILWERKEKQGIRMSSGG
jgi:hypothetical protein